MGLVAGLLVWSVEGSLARAEIKPLAPGLPMLRLTLDEALALFLRQNLDLLMTKYGIDFAKGQEITARLLPNPVLNLGTVSAFTQGQTLRSSSELVGNVQQLFELAGKRGYRIESARFGTQSAEANFEDTLRQLSFTVKDAYFRVQAAQRHLLLAEENLGRFKRILDVNTIRFNKGYIAGVDLIRIRLQTVDFESQVIQAIQERAAALTDLRLVLGVRAKTRLELVTELDYHRVSPDLDALQQVALEARPDIRMKRLTVSQREADWKLARAYRYPDPTFGPGFTIQGPRGPDNQQQYTLGLSVPLLLFNRNQGGIVQADVGIRTAEADLIKALLQVENQVELAYFNLIESRRLVEVYQAGVVDDARESLKIIETAYQKGGATILDLLDAARTAATIQGNYIDALFTYQHNLFQLESAVGKEVGS
jgi:cobalt-zinc-cadmium efflux system outer membrane protein